MREKEGAGRREEEGGRHNICVGGGWRYSGGAGGGGGGCMPQEVGHCRAFFESFVSEDVAVASIFVHLFSYSFIHLYYSFVCVLRGEGRGMEGRGEGRGGRREKQGRRGKGVEREEGDG